MNGAGGGGGDCGAGVVPFKTLINNDLGTFFWSVVPNRAKQTPTLQTFPGSCVPAPDLSDIVYFGCIMLCSGARALRCPGPGVSFDPVPSHPHCH